MLYTIKQACERLAVGRSHLSCLIRAGKIRTVQIGKLRVRIAEAEIDRFIADSTNGN